MKLDYSLTQSDFLTQMAFELRVVRVPLAGVTWFVWGLFFGALLLGGVAEKRRRSGRRSGEAGSDLRSGEAGSDLNI